MQEHFTCPTALIAALPIPQAHMAPGLVAQGSEGSAQATVSSAATLRSCFPRSWGQGHSQALTADGELHLPAGEAGCVGSCAEVGPSIPRGGRRDQEGPIGVELVARAQ